MGITLASGCFAAITPTHIAYLECVAGQSINGSIWIAMASAAVIREMKGKKAIPDDYRATMLNAIPFVAGVMVQETRTPEEIIRRWKPSLWIKGGDYTVDYLARTPEGLAVLECGGRIQTTPLIDGPSTTELLGCPINSLNLSRGGSTPAS